MTGDDDDIRAHDEGHHPRCPWTSAVMSMGITVDEIFISGDDDGHDVR